MDVSGWASSPRIRKNHWSFPKIQGVLRAKLFSSVSPEDKEAHCDSAQLSLPRAASAGSKFSDRSPRTHTFYNFPFCFPLSKSCVNAGAHSENSLSFTAPNNVYFYRAYIASSKMWAEKWLGSGFLFQMPRRGASWLHSYLLTEANLRDVVKRARLAEQSWRYQLSSDPWTTLDPDWSIQTPSAC